MTITIEVLSTSRLRRITHRRVPATVVALSAVMVGRPRPVTGLQVSGPRPAPRLGGARAGIMTLSYAYHGVANVQQDVVARRGTTIAVIEVDSTPDVAATAQAAFDQVLSAWRWR